MDNIKIAMKAKTLISIIAFVTAFSISVGIASLLQPQREEHSCFWALGRNKVEETFENPEVAAKITALLEEDIANGNLRDTKLQQLINDAVEPSEYESQKAIITREYWQVSSTIETENLPDDFVRAWQKHMQAWEKYADFLEDSTRADYKHCGERKYHKKISDTWYEVLRIAKQYGAEIPEGAY